MSVAILAASSPGEIRVAVAEGLTLLDYAIWRPGAPDGVGDVYRGRIIARVPAMSGAFVAIAGAEGFLPDSAGGAGRSAGEILAVRVTRAAQGGKGPRLAAVANEREAASVPSSFAGEVGGGSVALLQRGPNPIERFAAAYPDAPVLTDDAALLAALRPALGARLRLVARAFGPEIADEVAALSEPSVTLPGGVTIHIHPTPALVAMDTGPGTAAARPKGSAQQDANRAALPGLARQIRLRNLSGAILVDLAGLSVRKRAALGPVLAEALARDPLHPKFLGFTALGLAEIVRARIHPPLHEMLSGPHASGLAALRAVLAEAADAPHRAGRLVAAPAIVSALERDPVALPDLARRLGRPLILAADPALPPGAWRIDRPHG